MTQNQPGTSVPAVTPFVIPCSDLGRPIHSLLSKAYWQGSGLSIDDVAEHYGLDDDLQLSTHLGTIFLIEKIAERLESVAGWDSSARVFPGEAFATHRSDERWLELLDVCLADLVRARNFFHAEVNGSNEKGGTK